MHGGFPWDFTYWTRHPVLVMVECRPGVSVGAGRSRRHILTVHCRGPTGERTPKEWRCHPALPTRAVTVPLSPTPNLGMPQSKIREERGGREPPSVAQLYLWQSAGTHQSLAGQPEGLQNTSRHWGGVGGVREQLLPHSRGVHGLFDSPSFVLHGVSLTLELSMVV
ncbi:hypothetical protein Sjap_004763 [Stephania japonica]|uniref:Uncharacterized protein n=1 Tax=Stephania japonica TaxID=461633 RepID=A0AAP0K3U0_9MAGN